MLRFLSVLLLVGLSTGVFAQGRMSSTEIGFSYNLDHEFLLSERVARQGNLYKVYIRFRLNSGNVKIGDYELSYDLRSSYIDEKKINSSVLLEESNVIDNGFREFTFAIEFEKSDDDNLLVLQVENIVRNRKYQKDIPLSSANGIDHNPFLLFDAEKDIPFLRRKLGVVFQDFKLLNDRTVKDNLLFVLKATGWKDKPKMDERINSVLAKVDMETKAFKYPYELSGGEQQRIAIARALLNEPEIILADEPTGNLDPQTSVEVMEVLQEINKNGNTILMATHDYALILKYPSKTLKCDEQQIFEVVQKTV